MISLLTALCGRAVQDHKGNPYGDATGWGLHSGGRELWQPSSAAVHVQRCAGHCLAVHLAFTQAT